MVNINFLFLNELFLNYKVMIYQHQKLYLKYELQTL